MKKAVKGKEEEVLREIELLKDLDHPNVVSSSWEEEERGRRARELDDLDASTQVSQVEHCIYRQSRC